jgi:hypothetical protein
MICVYLGPGHGDSSTRAGVFDPGATHPTNRDLVEYDLASVYGHRAMRLLQAAGIMVEWIDGGKYGDRCERIAKYAKERGVTRGIYVQCHVNAGGGTYALARALAESKRGNEAVNLLMGAFRSTKGIAILPEITKTRTDPLYADVERARQAGRKPTRKPDGTEDWSWWTRGHVCIRDTYPIPGICGVIFEPGFIDSPAHAALWTLDGLDRIGAVLADGLIAWASAESAIRGPDGLRAAV